MRRHFYKVILLSVSTFETVVTGERHFSTASEARAYARSADPTGRTAIIYRMVNSEKEGESICRI